MIVTCNGTAISADVTNCRAGEGGRPAQFQTANIVAKNVRAWLKKESKWGRGLTKGRKRCDLCPEHLAMEQKAFAEECAAKEAKKKERDAMRIAKMSAAPLPKKPRKKKGDAAPSLPTASPSADFAPAPA